MSRLLLVRWTAMNILHRGTGIRVSLELILSTIVTELEGGIYSITGDKLFSKVVVIVGLKFQHDWVKRCLGLGK